MVEESRRREGIGSKLINIYVEKMCVLVNFPFCPILPLTRTHPNNFRRKLAQAEGLENIMLLAKDNLVPFYENAGFTNIGVSPVVHGVDPWNDLRMHL